MQDREIGPVAGQRLGREQRYQLIASLGSGGMAVVWRARDRKTGRLVAVKILRPDVEAAIRERFEREAGVMAQLHGRHVMPVHDVEVTGSLAWYVMDLARGGSLEGLLRRHGALEPGQAIDVAISVLRALETVHASGVVHRDVKPANLLFVDGVLCLADFGIARVGDGRTVPGQALGTPAYMAPEQLSGQVVGPAADLYATGAVLAHAITLRSPASVREAATLDALPEDLRPVVARACAFRPEDRFEDARACRLALERLRPAHPERPLLVEAGRATVGLAPTEAATAGGTTGRSRVLLPAAGSALVVALGLGWWVQRPAGPPVPDWADAIYQTAAPGSKSRLGSAALSSGVLGLADHGMGVVALLDPVAWLAAGRRSEADADAVVRGEWGTAFGLAVEGDPRASQVWVWSPADGAATAHGLEGAPGPTVRTGQVGVSGHADWLDFDGDGVLDVLVTERGLAGASIAYGPLPGELALDRGAREATVPALFVDLPNEGRTAYGPTVGDLDGDGTDDVVIPVRHPEAERWSVQLLFGGVRRLGALDAAALPGVRRRASKPDVLVHPAIGDLDGDGSPDLVVVSPSDAEAHVFWGPLGTTLGSPDLLRLPEEEIGRSVVLVDLDGDGRDELVLGAPNSTDRVYLWRGRDRGAGFGAPDRILNGLPGERLGIALETGDLDGDGRPDLVVLADRKFLPEQPGVAYAVRGTGP